MNRLNYAINFNPIIYKPNNHYSYNIIKSHKKAQIEEKSIKERSMTKKGLIFTVLIFISSAVFILGQQNNSD